MTTVTYDRTQIYVSPASLKVFLAIPFIRAAVGHRLRAGTLFTPSTAVDRKERKPKKATKIEVKALTPMPSSTMAPSMQKPVEVTLPPLQSNAWVGPPHVKAATERYGSLYPGYRPRMTMYKTLQQWCRLVISSWHGEIGTPPPALVLNGECGIGKTFMIRWVAEAYGIEMHSIDVGEPPPPVFRAKSATENMDDLDLQGDNNKWSSGIVRAKMRELRMLLTTPRSKPTIIHLSEWSAAPRGLAMAFRQCLLQLENRPQTTPVVLEILPVDAYPHRKRRRNAASTTAVIDSMAALFRHQPNCIWITVPSYLPDWWCSRVVCHLVTEFRQRSHTRERLEFYKFINETDLDRKRQLASEIGYLRQCEKYYIPEDDRARLIGQANRDLRRLHLQTEFFLQCPFEKPKQKTAQPCFARLWPDLITSALGLLQPPGAPLFQKAEPPHQTKVHPHDSKIDGALRNLSLPALAQTEVPPRDAEIKGALRNLSWPAMRHMIEVTHRPNTAAVMYALIILRIACPSAFYPRSSSHQQPQPQEETEPLEKTYFVRGFQDATVARKLARDYGWSELKWAWWFALCTWPSGTNATSTSFGHGTAIAPALEPPPEESSSTTTPSTKEHRPTVLTAGADAPLGTLFAVPWFRRLPLGGPTDVTPTTMIDGTKTTPVAETKKRKRQMEVDENGRVQIHYGSNLNRGDSDDDDEQMEIDEEELYRNMRSEDEQDPTSEQYEQRQDERTQREHERSQRHAFVNGKVHVAPPVKIVESGSALHELSDVMDWLCDLDQWDRKVPNELHNTSGLFGVRVLTHAMIGRRNISGPPPKWKDVQPATYLDRIGRAWMFGHESLMSADSRPSSTARLQAAMIRAAVSRRPDRSKPS